MILVVFPELITWLYFEVYAIVYTNFW